MRTGLPGTDVGARGHCTDRADAQAIDVRPLRANRLCYSVVEPVLMSQSPAERCSGHKDTRHRYSRAETRQDKWRTG